MELERLKYKHILSDLKKKMVFLVGPRQVGKTWLSKKIMTEYKKPAYLNYDIYDDKEIIRKQEWLTDTDLVIFDELHKMKGWKNYLKGVFDDRAKNLHILVTGSARLEVYPKAGDSLAGRYFIHHLLPLTFNEANTIHSESIVERLIARGGFPEPFLAQNDVDADKWRNQYAESLLREDMIDFALMLDMKAMSEIFERLRRSVGSTVSYSNIALDIGISPTTAKRYIYLLESLYIIFSIRPFSTKISRSLLKEPKIYFYDTGLVIGDIGSKTENMVAASLLTNLEYRNDIFGERNNLAYLRTKDAKEVDFALVNSNKVVETLIEVKTKDATIAPALKYFVGKYGYPGVQLVKELSKDRQDRETGIKIMNLETYFTDIEQI